MAQSDAERRFCPRDWRFASLFVARSAFFVALPHILKAYVLSQRLKEQREALADGAEE